MVDSEKLWRTLIRVEKVDLENGFLHVVIPSWDAQEIVRLNLCDVPPEVRQCVGYQMRFHAHINTSAESSEELRIERWEV